MHVMQAPLHAREILSLHLLQVFKGNYGPEADIWAAGIILYSLLCGDPPFDGATQVGMMLRHDVMS